jgi:hypothetical protein
LGAIRTVLDAAAHRFGMDVPVSRLGDRKCRSRILAEAASATPQLERALLFGASRSRSSITAFGTCSKPASRPRGDH